MRVLGIDPGSQYMGLGCVEARGNSFSWIGHEVAHVKDSKDISEKISAIFQAVKQAIEVWRPQAVSIEEVFFAKNPRSALKLGQARGVALAAAAFYDLPIFEYAPTVVKQSVTGHGRAEKIQVQKMVVAILGAQNVLHFEREDASDALALAICHLQHRHKYLILNAPSEKQKSVVGRMSGG